ncbi:MAG TPA: glycosyltransferase [Gemmatimonadaceae bacterium]|nr:glycosyltransferase [Gemmatimonadaceae bacterium]
MRILHVAGWYYPENVGGTEVYVSTLARLYTTIGHQVVIAAPLAGLDTPRSYEHDGTPVYRYPVPSNPTRDEAQGRVPARGSEHFRNWVADLKPDVAHFHSIVTGLGLAEMRAAKATGAQLIFTSHASSLGFICQRGTLMRLGEFPCDGLTEIVKCSVCELQNRGMPRALGEVIARQPVSLSRKLGAPENSAATALGMPDLIDRNRLYQRELFNIVDSFVVLTRWAERIVLKNGAHADRLFVNPLGVSELPESRSTIPRTTGSIVRFGYLGRFDVVKGVIELAQALRAMPSAARFNFEFRGPVSGDSERAVFERVRAMCAGDPRISLAPAVPSSEVANILASYDVLVCPSVCAEGGPTVAIEAHAVGTPVVGTRIGGLAELVRDGVDGKLVPPGDVNALTSLIQEIVDSPTDTIDRWRANVPPARTMTDVADDYLSIYGERLAVR